MPPLKLADLIGRQVLFLIPRIHPDVYQKVKLMGVEAGGIWIDSQELTNKFLRAAEMPAAPNTLVFFLPYHEIAFAIGTVEGTSLDEKAFGV